MKASECFDYIYENKNYKITLIEKDNGKLEIYVNSEMGDFYNYFEDKNNKDCFNIFKSIIERKQIKIKDTTNNNGELLLSFPYPRNFNSENNNEYHKMDTPNKKDNFEYNVYKEGENTYFIISKNNNTFIFKLSKKDLVSISFSYNTKEIIDDIKKRDIKLLINENNNGCLQVMNNEEKTLNPLDNIRKLNIMNYFFDEKPIFNQKPGITKLINEFNDKNKEEQIRMDKLIEEMKKKQKEILDTYPRLPKNIKVMKENAKLMIFPQIRTPPKKEPGVEIDSFIISKKNDFDLINNKLFLVHDNQNVNYELIYRASRDRDLASIFKKKCKNVRGTLIIVKTDSIENRRIFGGFTTKIWDDSERNYDDDKAFCFSVNEGKIYDLKKYCSAIGCDKNSGPRFCWIFEINNKFMMEGGKVYSEEVSHYNGQTSDYELNGGEEYFNVYELEVFKITPK